MKINRLDPEVEILDFEKQMSFELEANERQRNGYCEDRQLDRWWVYFKHGEIKNGCLLEGAYGNGSSIDAALKDYCKIISCRKMVFNATSPQERYETTMPKLIHTKLLGE